MLSPRVLAVFALFSGSASGLVLPGARAGAAAPTFDRRQALSAGFNAALATAALAAPAAVHAYDAIPTVEADFAEMERARNIRLAKAAKRAESLFAVVKKVEVTKTESEFVESMDALSLWVIGEGSIPEGVGVKELVKRLTVAYDALPKKNYACEATRTNNGICYTPGKGAELAYESTIKQIRKYSMIQLGDYRRVEFKAF